MVYARHPVLKGLDWHEIQVNIGASLEVKYPARAVLIGKNGYSDAGDMNNASNGYIGDMQFNRGERLGDIVLAAEAGYGDGKVFVFGDTSLLQVINLPYSYDFANRLFSWLSGSGKPVSETIDIIGIIMLILSAVSTVYLLKNRRIMSVIISSIIVLAVITQLFPAPLNGTGYSGRLVGVDISQGSLVKMNRDKDSIDGLLANIERNGCLPLLLNRGDYNPADFEAIILIAPSDKMSTDSISRLKSYMKDGGLVIMSSGWEQYDGCREFLDSFGLGLQNIPLGRGNKDEENKTASFWDVWAVSVNDPSNVDILAKEWDYPTAVHVPYGKGGLIFISDPQFFKNKNIEDIYSYNDVNIDFIKSIFDKYVKSNSIN